MAPKKHLLSPLAALLAALLSPIAAEAVVPGGPPPPAPPSATAAPAPPPAPAPDPPPAPPAARPPAPAPPMGETPKPPAPPAAAPAAPRPHLPHKPKAPPPEPLPEAQIRARVIAPSAQGPWTLRLENDGSRWLRVPADLRLLHLTVESGDSMGRRHDPHIKCALPAALRPDGFPERNAVMLGPGDAYVETFDPRLFCFGKAAKALAGGVVVRATYGWDEPHGARHAEQPPFAVEGTTYPAAVQPRRSLVVPTLVLSWLPPEEPEPPPALPLAAPPSPAPPSSAAPHPGPAQPPNAELLPSPAPPSSAVTPGPAPAAKPDAAKPDAAKPDAEEEEEAPAADAAHPAVAIPVDENAPRLEVTAAPFAEAADGRRVSLTVTVANVGHRATMASIRARMVGFRIEGPDGVVRCHPPDASHHGVPREGFQTLKPGASVALPILISEACGRDVFERPGLYHVTPSVHLHESGADVGVSALTGHFHAAEATLVRVASGPEPFYKHAPRPVRATPPPAEP